MKVHVSAVPQPQSVSWSKCGITPLFGAYQWTSPLCSDILHSPGPTITQNSLVHTHTLLHSTLISCSFLVGQYCTSTLWCIHLHSQLCFDLLGYLGLTTTFWYTDVCPALCFDLLHSPGQIGTLCPLVTSKQTPLLYSVHIYHSLTLTTSGMYKCTPLIFSDLVHCHGWTIAQACSLVGPVVLLHCGPTTCTLLVK
jgi:hypothetical protein